MEPIDLKTKLRDAVRRHPSPTRRQVAARTRAALVAGYGGALVLFVLAGAARVGPRPLALVAGTASGTALVAALASWAVLGRERGRMGRGRRALAGAVGATPVAVLAWRVLLDARFAPLAWHTPGLRCFALLTLFAAGPFAALAFLRRGAEPAQPRLLGAALAVASGAFAAALVDLWCPCGDVGHLVLGHLAPFVVLALAGASIGGRVLGLRSA